MNLQLYCKKFTKRPPKERYCGAIVDIDHDLKKGDIIDITYASSYKELEEWFYRYKMTCKDSYNFITGEIL